MSKLNLALEIRDFDLERLGFSLSVLDPQNRGQSEGYLQMTLPELDAFLRALKAPNAEIALSTPVPSSQEPSDDERPEDGSSSLLSTPASLDLEEQLRTLPSPPKSAGFGFRRAKPLQEIRVPRA